MTLLLPLLGGLWGRLAPYAIAALVGGALVVGIYQTGVRAERKRGEAAALRAEIATLTRDRDIARQAEADAAARAAALDAASRADRALLEEIRRAPPNPSCRLSERDARRLQRIGAGAGR